LGAGAQRVRSHHDPLAVGGQDQQIAGLCARRAAGLVEVLEVHRGQGSELLDLALSEPNAGLAADRIARVLVAAARALQRAQLAQPVRVALDRQIQRRVGGMQVPHPGRPVRPPPHAYGPEHRLQRAPVTILHAAADHSLIASDLLKPRLAQGAQRQMIIEQAAQQLPPVNIKMLLKLGMRQAGGVGPIKEADQRLELLPAGDKGTAGRLARRAAAAAPARGFGCSLAVSLPGGQDFTARGVKFATTGVEIGDHAGHLRGRRGIRATPTSTPDLRVLAPAHQPRNPPQTAQNVKTPASASANGSTPGNRPPDSPKTVTPRPGATASKPRIYRGFTVSSARPRVP
jgi:hypothetical protein